jgi:hypothetical protein
MMLTKYIIFPPALCIHNGFANQRFFDIIRFYITKYDRVFFLQEFSIVSHCQLILQFDIDVKSDKITHRLNYRYLFAYQVLVAQSTYMFNLAQLT